MLNLPETLSNTINHRYVILRMLAAQILPTQLVNACDDLDVKDLQGTKRKDTCQRNLASHRHL